MAKLVHETQWNARRYARRDWSQYTDGQVWCFVKGEDYEEASKLFVSKLFNVARREGLGVRTSIRKQEDSESVVCQFFPREAKTAEDVHLQIIRNVLDDKDVKDSFSGNEFLEAILNDIPAES